MKPLLNSLSSLLESKEFIAAIVGAVIGGLVAGCFSLLAQNKAAKDQRKRDREVERQAVNGTLQAIEAELITFQKKLLDAYKRVFENEKPSDFWNPVKLSPGMQNHFTVFESNASNLGRVGDPELRRKIVGTYTTAKALLDVVNYYNERLKIWERLRHQPNANEEIKDARTQLDS